MRLVVLSALLLIGCARFSDDSDVSPAVEPVEIVRDADGYDFFWPMSIAEDDGQVFIADFRDCCIHVFDHSMTHLDTIGRKGEGPGEFEALINIAVGNGVLAALNLSPPRISLFSYSGIPIREIPVEVTRWGDVAITDRNTILLARYARGSDVFVSEYSAEGEIVGEFLQHSQEADFYASYLYQCRVAHQGSQGYIVFEHLPRIIVFGESEFDLQHDFNEVYPWFNRLLRMRERIKRKYGRNSFTALATWGGFVILDDHLVLSGPDYDLLILDRQTNLVRHLEQGSLGADLSYQHQSTMIKRSNTLDRSRMGTSVSGIPTYWDGERVGDEVWMLSTMNSCLVRFRIADLLAAGASGTVIGVTEYTEEDW
ncbi:hypothetical protein ACFL6R_00385 [Gemmatimonadota bacterium]